MFLSANKALADGPRVFINELMWRGSSASTSDEWIELYNDSDEVVDLSGWSIFDEVKQEVMVSIDDGQIAPHHFFLISNNKKDHKFSGGESILNIDPDAVDSAVSLNNSDFRISVRDADGNILDTAGDGGKPFFGEHNGQIASMQRIDYSLSGDDKNAWSFSGERKNLDDGVQDFATPENSGRPRINFIDLKKTKYKFGEGFSFNFDYDVSDSRADLEKITVSILRGEGEFLSRTEDFGKRVFFFPSYDFCPRVKIRFSDAVGLWAEKIFDLTCYWASRDIKLYEVMPKPGNFDCNKDGVIDLDDEWVELVNFGHDSISLNGWQIKDAAEKIYEIGEVVIGPEAFKYFCKSETKIGLNDSEERVYLISPEGKIVDEIYYKNAKRGNSWARWGDGWFWTTQATPGEMNKILQPKEDKSPEYYELQEAEGKKVRIKGTVSEIERSKIIVAFGGGSVEVDLPGAVFEGKAGDKVTISGLNHSGTLPIIAAGEISINLNKRASRGKAGSSSVLSEKASPSEEQLIEVRRKIRKTKRIVYEKLPSEISGLVMGSKTSRVISFNHRQHLLYLLGVFGFMITIFIYDFCCRE